jgi:anthranilate synthase component I
MSNGTTTREQFAALQEGHKVVPVIRELFADGETPVGIYRKLAAGRPGTFLLESAEQGGIWSRYSFIGVSSFGVLTQTGDRASWQDYGLSEQRALGPDAPTAPLEALARLYERWTTPRIPGHPPLTGGLVGFIGWEAIRQIEHLPDRPPADFPIPGQALSFVRELVVVDHRTGSVLLIATALNDGTQSEDERWDAAQDRLDQLQAGLAQPAEAFLAQVDFGTPVTATPRITPDAFRTAVARAKDHITAGDVFQVVISQRFDHAVTADPIDVYRVLRTLNPSPYT